MANRMMFDESGRESPLVTLAMAVLLGLSSFLAFDALAQAAFPVLMARASFGVVGVVACALG